MKNSANKIVDSLVSSGRDGIRWAGSGGESHPFEENRCLAIHGIHNVINIFEEIVEDRLNDVDFIEALSCTEGCLGGPLTVVNPFISKTNLKLHMKHSDDDFSKGNTAADFQNLLWTQDMEYKPILTLDDNMMKAMQKMQKLEEINDGLPGLDCGACGAPSCRVLAEDIVRGLAVETDCIVKLREKVSDLADQMRVFEHISKPKAEEE